MIAQKAHLDAVQLHGDEDEAFIQALKEKTDVEVWKAVQIRSAVAVSYTHLDVYKRQCLLYLQYIHPIKALLVNQQD